MAVPYTKTDFALTVIVGFRPVVIPSSHPNFAKLSQLVKEPRTVEADVTPLLDIPAAITAFTGDEIKVINGKLFYRGVEVKDNLAKVILDFVKSGDPSAALPFQLFLANCRANPDPKLVDTIYDWCVKGNLPITPDGELIAWKIVDRNYQSITSGRRGKLDHSIGATVTEPREECDPNRNQTCSTGIHFCSLEYLEKGNYGGGLTGNNRIIAVVINPRDITAIPTDYNLSKGRCCELRVVGEVPNNKVPSYYDNSPKVYRGWSAPAKPLQLVELPLRNGDVVRLRDGRQVTVSNSREADGPIAGYDGNRRSVFYRATGRTMYAFPEQIVAGRDEFPDDVVETISRASSVELVQRLDLRDGDVVVTRDGQTVKVTSRSSDTSVCWTTGYVFRKTGICAATAAGTPVTHPNGQPQDVVRVVSRAPVTPRTSGGIAKGQVWMNRAGEQVTIADTNAAGDYQVRDTDGRSYTASGRFNSNSSVSQLDLVRLVIDVA